jgi:phosphatidylserine/phosphatidylglycerophosphate/cardiolipin synthase-like enzyme
MSRAQTTCAVVFVVLVVAVIVAYGAWRLVGGLDPATVCITHHAHIVRCTPIDRKDSRDRHLRAMCHSAADQVLMFTSFADVAATRQLQGLTAELRPGVRCAVYYEPRPTDPQSHAVHQLMGELAPRVRSYPLKRRVVTNGRFPFIHGASTHYKVCVADDTHFLCGSANALDECYYMHDTPAVTCRDAENLFLAPAMLEFDVAFTLSCPVPQISEYLTVIAQQQPWAERSLHLTFADRCEFHIFPAAVLSRDGFLAGLVGAAHSRVMVMALSVWPTGEFRTALVAAVARGCTVTLIGSAYECSQSQQLLSRLNRCAASTARWEYREWTPADGLVHAKFILLDDDVVLPSFNFSYKSVAAALDDETALVLRGPPARESREALLRMIEQRSAVVVPPNDPVGNAMLGLLNPLL